MFRTYLSTFLLNHSTIIYTTAPSLFDIALGYQGFLNLLTHKETLKKAIEVRQACVKSCLVSKCKDSFVRIVYLRERSCSFDTTKDYKRGLLVRAIRYPTVKNPIFKIIPRVSNTCCLYRRLCMLVQKFA